MKIVIIGGGFGGLTFARKLSKKKDFDITLIDRFNFHQFQPLFYQVATAGLDASNISFPLRKLFHNDSNVHIRMTEVKSIDITNNQVITDEQTFFYDILAIATGADTNFFGNEDLIAHTYPMKSTIEALQIKYCLLKHMEDALYEKDEAKLQSLMTVVIVGGGPTGVEMSGAIADMRRFVFPKDYPELDFSRMKIYLLEGSPRTLNAMSEKSSRDSHNYLNKLNVIVKTGTIVSNYDGKTVTMKNGDTIESSMVIWAAGIKGNVPDGIDRTIVVRGNRITTDRFHKVKGTENIYAIGDVAHMETDSYPHGHPQLASVAIAQARSLANNLIKASENKAMKEFEYDDKGTMATVGRNLAVVDIPKTKIHLKGFIAWVFWMTLHLFLLLGVKNRFAVFGNWIYNYLTYDQNLRLIFKVFKKQQAA
jgi:NADH:quinone reductase (non-electrogenic)